MSPQGQDSSNQRAVDRAQAGRPVPLLLSAEALMSQRADDRPVLIDCRFALAEPGQGRSEWLRGHIPGAHYAHLDEDLAGPVTSVSGRHPLPDPRTFAAFLARCGWSPGRAIVAYDAQGGAFAARLWWLLRYFGHDVVALLDGGLAAWVHAGGALESGPTPASACEPAPLQADAGLVCLVGELQAGLDEGSLQLVDARDAGRYAGDNETIDPVAGHVPGSINRPFSGNLAKDGRFRSPAALRAEFESLLMERAEADPALPTAPAPQGLLPTVHMCGSGVTACHNLFAMTLAGMNGGALYPGSWSEWIRDRDRPVATGP